MAPLGWALGLGLWADSATFAVLKFCELRLDGGARNRARGVNRIYPKNTQKNIKKKKVPKKKKEEPKSL
jgi:hypothetical protein